MLLKKLHGLLFFMIDITLYKISMLFFCVWSISLFIWQNMKLYDFKEFTGTKKFNIFSVFTADDFR
jgi:hypothetical protein